MLDSRSFYGEYHGHRVQDLETLLREVRGERGVVFLAGDSSLDNKFWFRDTSPVVGGYERVLLPPSSKEDIAHCINKELLDRQSGAGLWPSARDLVAINCAVEESSLGERRNGHLLPQDAFLRDNITESDVAVVSVGGNDVALRPSLCTALSLLLLHCVSTEACLDRCSFGCALPLEDRCPGCPGSCLSNCLACPPGFGYFIHLFRVQTEAYLAALLGKRKPRLLIVCMLYYPDERSTGSWADRTLDLLNYSTSPGRVQTILRRLFELAISSVRVPGCRVRPVPLFSVLDGKNSEDYCQRVEPSAIGGRKVARLIVEAIKEDEDLRAVTTPFRPMERSRLI